MDRDATFCVWTQTYQCFFRRGFANFEKIVKEIASVLEIRHKDMYST